MERIVEEFVTDLVETSSSCSFKWRINNISTASPKKDFLIKSKEFYFYDANAKWYVKIGQFVYNANQKYLGVTFMLSDDGKDENARYKFSIKLESGLVMESQFISKNKTSKGATLEYQMGQFIPLESGCESIELEPTVIFETLTIDTKPNYPQETVEEEIPVETNADESIDDGAKVAEAIAAQALVTDDEDEFDTLVDLKGIVVPEIVVTKEGEASTERTDFSISTESDFKGTSSESEDIDDSDSEYDVFEAVQDDKSRADYKMSNLELTKQIRKIYMQKMKQIADTSSRLLVTAARVSRGKCRIFKIY